MHATGLLHFLLAMRVQRTSSQDVQSSMEINQETREGAPLTEEEFASAATKELNEASENVDVSGMYNTDLFEGDVVNPDLIAQSIRSRAEGTVENQRNVFRNALRSQSKLWPNGRVPYTISPAHSPYGRLVIAAAIAEFHAHTCIKFVPKQASDVDHVDIISIFGCAAYAGRYGGKQLLSLKIGCLNKGVAIHEMMHTIGFKHEQSRFDRDDYVKINWQNIDVFGRRQFEKYSPEYITHLGTPYDYGSVMHYDMRAFSWNGLPTIEPRQAGAKIGQRRGFSENDITKINRLYNCDMSNATTTIAPPKPFRPCKDKLSNCAFMKTAGHCEFDYSKQFMQSNCPVSCDSCREDGSAPCIDETPLCESWEASLYCVLPHLKEHMHSKCPSACSLC